MERNYLLPQNGKFYKANLHSHTTLSDGTLSPEELKKAYQENGYSIVAITDHRHYEYHKELNDDSFLALAAYEVDVNEQVQRNFAGTKTYHINLYDTNPEENKEKKQTSILPEGNYDPKYINQFVAEMKELGFLACYNHPYWSLQNYEDYKDLQGFFAMEIYNYGCEHDGLYGYNPQSYDEMLRTGHRLFCVATDDNHNGFPFGHPLCDSFGGFIMIKAQEFSYSGIIEALKNGWFYSSMGPEIKEIYIENRHLIVKSSPVEKIFVIQEGRRCYKKLAEPGQTICEAEFPIEGNEGYFRIDCRDSHGLHACSNAYFIDELFTKEDYL